MDYFIASITGLTLIGTIILVFLAIKKQKYDDLWEEVCHFRNDKHLPDEWILRVKAIDSVIQFGAIYSKSGETNEVKSRAKEFKERAERLKKWYVFW